jgi:hypothetical protein
MKVIVTTVLLMVASLSSAAPILQKYQDAGYVMPQNYEAFSCQIFMDHIKIDRAFAMGASFSEQRPVTIGEGILELIVAAESDQLVSDGTICDAPATRISAYKPDGTSILLYGFSTCNADGSRNGEAATILKNFVNAVCGDIDQ